MSVCVCVSVCVMVGGLGPATGLRRQDQHQYSGVALTLVVHGPKIGQWDTTHRRQPKRHVLRPDSNSPRHFPFDNTHTHKKSRFLTWGDETTSSWLKTETLSAENKNKKYYVELKNIYFLMHLRNREIRHQHTNSLFFFFFDIQLLQQQNFLIHIKALN